MLCCPTAAHTEWTPARMQYDFINVFGESTASIWQAIDSNPNSLGNLSVTLKTNFSGPSRALQVWNTSWNSVQQVPACADGSCGNATLGMAALWQVWCKRVWAAVRCIRAVCMLGLPCYMCILTRSAGNSNVAHGHPTQQQVADWLNVSLTPLFDSYCEDNMSTSFIEYYDTANAQGQQFRSALGLPADCSERNDVTCGPFYCYINTSYTILTVCCFLAHGANLLAHCTFLFLTSQLYHCALHIQVIITAFLILYFVMYCISLSCALLQLKRLPYMPFRTANAMLQLQMRERCELLLWW